MSDSLRPHGLYKGNSLGQNAGVGSLFLFQGIFPTQGSNPGLPHCRDSLPAEPQGKPRNTGEGSLSLLQQIFPIQESNRGLLQCRQFLYQLSYEGNPIAMKYILCPLIFNWFRKSKHFSDFVQFYSSGI